MKNKILTLLVILLGSMAMFAQTPGWLWSKHAGGTMIDVAYSVAADDSGNSYVAGVYESASITFGSTTLNNSSADTTDLFLVKYDPYGSVLWAKSAGGVLNDGANSVAVDDSGNVYLVGNFESTSITFGAFTLNNTSTISGDIFIVKYDAGGNVIWAKSAGGNFDDAATSVATDYAGNILVAGYFQSAPVTFDAFTVNNSGNYDMFIVKYDSGGNALWATGAGGSNEDRGYAVTADDSGNVFVAGTFVSASIVIGSTTLNYAGGAYSDIFLAKYDVNGNAVWAQGAGGTYLDEPNSIVTDASGNVYMTGIAYSTSITFGSTVLTNSGSTFYCDVFIVKYNSAGNPQWAHGGGTGSYNDFGYSVAVDTIGNIYVSGFFGPSITLDSLTLTFGGVFIMKFDSNGSGIWAISVAGGSGNAIDIDPSGDIHVTGRIHNPNMYIPPNNLPNAGMYDMFIAKLSTSTGLTESTSPFTYSVYPNPFCQYAILQFENPKNEKLTLALFDGEGRLVKTIGNITTGKIEIDRSNLASGLYLFQLRAENEIRTSGKIIVE